MIGELDVHGVAAEFALELVGRALGDDPPAVHDGQPAGEPVGLLQVVRGEQDGQPLVGGEPPDLVPHGRARLRVQAGGRLVEEQHLRPVDQAERDVQPPLHAAGVGADQPAGRVGQVEPAEQLVGPAASAAARAGPGCRPGQQQVLPAGGHRVGAAALGDHADGVADPGRPGPHVQPGHRARCRSRPGPGW